MAYRAPYFASHHALRVAGAAAVTVTNEAAGFPKARLLDSRTDALFQFNTSAANHDIIVDRGAGTLISLDRMIIPSGHNFAGASATVVSDNDVAFGSPTTLFTGTLPAGLIDQALTASNERYWRLRISTSGQWALAELVYTTRRTAPVGPDPEYRDVLVPNFAEATLRSGNAYRLGLGEDRREFEMRFNAVTTAQLVTFDLLWSETSQGRYPLWFGPPDDAEPSLHAHFIDRYVRAQDSPNPTATGLMFEVGLQLREVLS